MRCKVILSTNIAVEIITELDNVKKDYVLVVLEEFENYSKAEKYILSEDCLYSSYLVVEIAEMVMVIPKREIGKYSDYTLLKAFITRDKAEEYRDDCYA